MNSKTFLYILQGIFLFLSLSFMTGCETKKATIDENYPNYLAIVEDVAGNQDGVPATAAEINSLLEVDGARDNLDYSIGFILMGADMQQYGLSYENREKPTPAEIQRVVNAVNISADILIQIGNEADDTTGKSVVTMQQIKSIIPPIRRIVEGRIALYRAYIDKYPDRFSSPATQPEVQAMIDAVNADQQKLDINSIQMVAKPTIVFADGQETSLITIVLKRKSGERLSNVNVSLSQGGGKSTIFNSRNNGNGVYTFRVKSNAVEKVTYGLIVDGQHLPKQASVNFVPLPVFAANSLVQANPTTVIADGKHFSTITVTVKNARKELITDANVVLKQNGTSSISKVKNNHNGTYEFKVVSNQVQTVTYEAIANGIKVKGSAQVNFTYDPNPDNWRVTLTPSTQDVIASSKRVIKGKIVAEVKDLSGHPVTNATGDDAIGLDQGTQTSHIYPTVNKGNGNYEIEVSSAVLVNVHYTAKVGDNLHEEGKANVNFIPDLNEDNWVITLSPINQDVNISTSIKPTHATITVSVKDKEGNPISNLASKLTLSSTTNGQTSTIGQTSGDNGVYSVNVSATSEQTVVYQAKIDAVHTESSATVKYTIPDNPEDWEITLLVADPATDVPADGTTSSTVSATVKVKGSTQPVDVAGLHISGGEPSTHSAVNFSDKDNGVYTFTVKSTKVQDVTYHVDAYHIDKPDGNTTKSKDVTIGFVYPPPANWNITLVANPDTDVTADGKTISTVTATVTVKNTNQPVNVAALHISGGGQSTHSVVDFSNKDNGVYIFTVTSEEPGDVTYYVDAYIKGGNDSITTNSKDVSIGFISVPNGNVVANPETVIAGTHAESHSTITVSVSNSANNPVTNAVVTLDANVTKVTISDVVNKGDGNYTFDVNTTLAQNVKFTAHATYDNLTKEMGSDTVTFRAGAMDVSLSRVETNTTEVVANGTSEALITVTLMDKYENPIKEGNDAILEESNNTNISTISGVNNHHDGTYTFTVTSTKSGDITYQGRDSVQHLQITRKATVKFVPGPPVKSSIIADPTEVDADGTAASTLDVYLEDADGNGAYGHTVTIYEYETQNSSITDVVDQGNGHYTATVTSSTIGEYTYKGTYNNKPVEGEAKVNFIKPRELNVSLTATPTEVVVGTTPNVTLVATITTKTGTPVIGATVTFPDTKKSVVNAVAAENGNYTFEASDTKAETVNYKVLVGGKDYNETVTVTYKPGKPNATNSFIALKDGTSAEITLKEDAHGSLVATVRDDFNNSIPDATVVIFANPNTTTQTTPPHNNNDGTYSFDANNTYVEVVNYTMTANAVAIEDGEALTFLPGAVDPTTSTVVADPEKVEKLSGTSTITVTLKDLHGNLVPNKTVALTADPSTGMTITPDSDNSDPAVGKHVFVVQSSIEQTVVFTAIATGGIEIDQKPSVQFGPGAPDKVTFTVDDDNVTVDDTITGTVVLKDSNNDVIKTQHNVTITANPDQNATIGVVSFDENTGEYTMSINDTKAETLTLTATVDNNESLTQTQVVTFTHSIDPNNWILNLSAIPNEVKANGEIATLTGILTDKGGNVINDADITITQNGQSNIGDGKLTNPNKDNIYTLEVSSTEVETVAYTATTVYMGDTIELNTTNVIFESAGLNVQIKAAENNVTVSKTEGTTITVSVFDSSNHPLNDLEPTLDDADPIAVIETAEHTLGTNVYTYKVHTTKARDVNYTASATYNGATDTNSVIVTYVHGTMDPTKSTVKADPPEGVRANGVDKSTITVTLKDGFDNPIDDGVDVTLEIVGDDSSRVAYVENPNDTDGNYTFTVTSTIKGTFDYKAREGKAPNNTGVDQTASVTYVPDSLDRLEIISSPEQIGLEDGIFGTIVVEAYDAHDNRITDLTAATLSLVTTGTNITIGDFVYNGSGVKEQYESNISSSTEQEADFYAESGSKQSNTVTVKFANGNAEYVKLSAKNDDKEAIADGKEKITLVAKITDKDHEPTSGSIAPTGTPVTSNICASWTLIELGTYECDINTTVADTYSYKVIVDGNISITDTIEDIVFNPGPVDLNKSQLDTTTSGLQLKPDAKGLLILKLVDAYNNRIDRAISEITMTDDSEYSEIFNGRKDTDNKGIYFFDTNSTRPINVVYTATVIEGEVDTESIQYLIGNVDPDHSLVSANPTSIDVDGSTSIVRVTVRDFLDNNITNQPAKLTCEGVDIEPIPAADDSDKEHGIYDFTITSTTARGTLVCTARAGGTIITQKASIVIGKVDGFSLEVSANPATNVEISESNGTTVTVRIWDASNHLANADSTPTLIGDPTAGGHIGEGNKTDIGTYTYKVGTTKKGTVTYTATATIGTITESAMTTVSYINPPSDKIKVTLSPAEQTITVGEPGGTIAVKAVSSENPDINISDITISLLADTGSSVSGTCETNASGECTITVKDDTSETVVYTPLADGNATHPNSNKATVNFQPDDSEIHIKLTSSHDTQVVGDDITITVEARGKLGNLLDGKNVSVDNNGSAETSSCVTGNTGTIGTCTVTLTDTVAELVQFTSNTVDGEAPDSVVPVNVNFTNPPESEMVVTLSPVEQNITVGDTGGTIKATVTKQGTDLLLEGVNISLVADGGLSTSTPCTTDGQGECTIIVKDDRVQTVVYTPKANNATPHEESNTATVHFTNGAVGDVTITADKSDVTADGTDVATLIVTVKDVKGNPIKDAIVTLIDSPHDTLNIFSETVNNGDGTYTIQVSSTELGTVTYTAVVNDVESDASVNVIFVVGEVDLEKSSIQVYEDFNLTDPTDYGTEVNGLVAAGKQLRAIITLRDAAGHLVDTSDQSANLAFVFNADENPPYGVTDVEHSIIGNSINKIDNTKYYQDFKVQKISSNTIGATYISDDITKNDAPELRDVNITFSSVDKNKSAFKCEVFGKASLDSNYTFIRRYDKYCVIPLPYSFDDGEMYAGVENIKWKISAKLSDSYDNEVVVSDTNDFEYTITQGEALSSGFIKLIDIINITDNTPLSYDYFVAEFNQDTNASASANDYIFELYIGENGVNVFKTPGNYKDRYTEGEDGVLKLFGPYMQVYLKNTEYYDKDNYKYLFEF